MSVSFPLNRKLFSSTERTEKVPMGSIKNVVTETIEGHDGYHMMVTAAATHLSVILRSRQLGKKTTSSD